MKLFFLVLLVAATVSARANSQASFDCTKASTLVERTICADVRLSQLDVEMTHRYDQRRASLSMQERAWLDDAQKYWLGHRDELCGLGAPRRIKTKEEGGVAREVRACLLVEYQRRIAQFDPVKVPPKHHADILIGDILGDWFYVPSEGGLQIKQSNNGNISFSIETVSGPTFHLCNVDAKSALLTRDVLSTTIKGDDPYETPPKPGQCKIAIRIAGDNAWVESNGAVCRNFCGARGYFGGEYRKVQK